MPDMDYKEIGRRIEIRRKELDMTLTDLAASVDLSASTIQRYEKGKFDRIKLPVIEAIASALHVNPAWLIGNTDDPTDYEDGDLLASIPSSYMELFDGDVYKALQYMAAVDEEALTLQDGMNQIRNQPGAQDDGLSPLEAQLLSIYRSVNGQGQRYIMKQAEFAAAQEEYRPAPPKSGATAAG